MIVRNLATLATLAVLAAGSASAATLDYDVVSPIEVGTSAMAVAASKSGDTLDVTFSWEDTSDGGVSGALDFHAPGGFDLYFTGYTDLEPFLELDRLLVSGMFVQQIDGSGDPIKEFEGNLDTADCIFSAATECSVVTGPGATKVGSDFDFYMDVAYLADESAPVLSVMEGGFFRLGAIETGVPSAGFMDFRIEAKGGPSVVPLPAGLPLLLGGLGLLGVMRKRRKG